MTNRMRKVASGVALCIVASSVAPSLVRANTFEIGTTSVENIMTCGPRGLMWSQSRALGDCLSDNSGGRARIYCDSVDQPISIGAFVNGGHSVGPVRISVGTMEVAVTAQNAPAPVFTGKARIQPGQDDPRDAGGLSAPVRVPKLPLGTYSVRARYSGGTQWHDHGHPVVIVWPPAETTRVMYVVDCSSPIKVEALERDNIGYYRLSSGSCPDGIFHAWTVRAAARFGNRELARFYGCSVDIRSSYDGMRVDTVQLDRSAFPKHPSTLRRPVKEACRVGTGGTPNLSEIDWSQWGEPAKLEIKRKLFAQWRVGHPVGSPSGSTAAFRAYADLVNSFMESGAPPSPEITAIWQALNQVDEEIKLLGPILLDTLKCSLSLRSVTQAFDTSVAILGGILESGNNFLHGISLGVAMLSDSPQQFFDSAALWLSVAGQKDFSELMVMAADFGIEVTKAQAVAFLDSIAEVNSAALAGDDRKIAELLGKMAGNLVFDELFALGSAKAAAKGIDGLKKLSTGVRKSFDEALERLSPAIRRSDALRSTEIKVRDMAKYGIDPFTADSIDAVARDTGTILEFRQSNPLGLDCINSGDCLPKPQGLDGVKSVRAEDLKIGAPPEAQGKVWWGEPQDPGAGASPELRKYYSDARKKYEESREMREWLQESPKTRGAPPKGAEEVYGIRYERGKEFNLQISIDSDGIVREVGSGKAFGPDLDLWAIRDAKTGELVEPDRARAVYDRLGMSANVQHGRDGGTAHWNAPGTKREDLFQKHDRTLNHGNATEALMQFGSGSSRLPRTTFANLRESNAYIARYYGKGPGR